LRYDAQRSLIVCRISARRLNATYTSITPPPRGLRAGPHAQRRFGLGARGNAAGGTGPCLGVACLRAGTQTGNVL